MKRYPVHPKDPFAGLFSDVFIIGVGRAANRASDFTDADTSQTITLLTPAAGDVVTYPFAQAWTKIAFAGGALSAVTLDVGFDGGEEWLKDGAMFAAGATIGPLSTVASKAFSGSVLITAKVDTTGANLSEITAGEIWIYVTILRVNDYVNLLYG